MLFFVVKYLYDLKVRRSHKRNRKDFGMEIVLIIILLISALFIIGAVLLQHGNEGLSGTIAGGQETFYGKEKSARTDKILFKWTLIASIVFAVAVLLAYIIQPDYANGFDLDAWQSLSGYSSIFE